jgi:haloacetate dehalogenase
MIQSYGDVLGIWAGYCGEGVKISGKSLNCGHYVPEEQPEEVLAEILDFLS